MRHKIAYWGKAFLPTLLVVLVVEASSHLSFSSLALFPGVVTVFYLGAVVYSSLLFGLTAGLVSAIIIVTYSFWLFSPLRGLFNYSADTLQRFIVFGLTLPAAALLIGFLKKHTDELLTRERKLRGRIEKSEKKFRSLIEKSWDGIALVDRGGKFVFISPSVTRIFGFSAEEMIEKKSIDLVHPQVKKKYRRLFMRVARVPSDSTTFQVRNRHKNGSFVWIENTITNLLHDPAVSALVFNFRDITKNKEAEEELKKFKFISDHANDVKFLIDEKGRFLYANRVATKKLGYPERELLKMSVVDIDASRPIEEFRKTYAVSQKQKVPSFETLYKKKDGSTYPVEVSVTPIVYNNQSFLFAIASDITKRKIIEERKDEFISTTGHELKTPLTTIKAFIQLLRRDFDTSADKKTARYLMKIDSQINKLITLVYQLLDFSKIQTGKMELKKERIDFDELVEDVIENMQETITTHHIIREGKTKKKVLADRYRIEQVLTNLLSNAVRYSPGEDRVIVELESGRNNVIVRVHDSGIGVPPQERDKIFTRFYTAPNNTTKTTSGLGLGLYISAEIVKHHEGKIWLHNRKDRGTTFSFKLPVS